MLIRHVALKLAEEGIELRVGALSRAWARRLLMMCRPHSARLPTRGAIPSGWSASRKTLMGGSTRRGGARRQQAERTVGGNELAVGLHDHRGTGEVAVENAPEHAHRGPESLRVSRDSGNSGA